MKNTSASNGFFQQVYALVAQIPAGKVATYGQIARMLGNPCGARTVGWALHSIPANLKLPWHRVVNSRGKISTGKNEPYPPEQRILLEAEGIEFDASGKINLERFQHIFFP